MTLSSNKNAESSPAVVSCARNPLDLRPALDAIELEIRQRRQNGPLFIIMSESHTTPTHKLLRQALMTRLLGTTSPAALTASQTNPLKIAYGAEVNNDHLGRIVGLTFSAIRVDFPASFEAMLSNGDRNGQHYLSLASTMQNHALDAPVTHRLMADFLRSQQISYRNNDAPEALRNIAKGSLGIAVRNSHLFSNALGHQIESHADVYIQDCGRAHLFGSERDGLEYSDSLTAMFSAADVHILPVFMRLSQTMDDVPSAARTAFNNSVVVEGLDDRTFNHRSPAGAEYAFCRSVAENSGMKISSPVVSETRVEDTERNILEWTVDTVRKNIGSPSFMFSRLP